jgi:hypothetical protein
VTAAALAVTGAVFASGTKGLAATAQAPAPSCTLANGVQHVIEVTFDNVHFNRDNPNVLSDLEQMPALKNFIETNGTLLSNNHTPLIAHTADDTITNYSGLYGDRHGLGITNDYELYSSGGSIGSQGAFSYWTGAGGDAYPNMAYSSTVPPSGPPTTPPAPWVPFTRAGCDFGGVSTSNMELENSNPDIQNTFGAASPEAAQLNADPNSFKDQETNDYLGLAVHCAAGDSFCSAAQAVKYGQTTPSPTAAADVLPDEPGGYNGYQALFGHKYLQPQLDTLAATGHDAAGNLVRTVNGHAYEIANAAGNLVDLNGKQINGQFVHTPGFPGFGPISAAQSLAYVADMQESGVPITYAYISDVHEVKSYDKGPCSPASTFKGHPDVGAADGPGDPCYYQTTAAYDAAFQTFFNRLADDGITPQNTLFVFTADEGDHFAGVNANRAVTPTCSGLPGTMSYTCIYANGQKGEQAVDIHGLLNLQQGVTTAFYNEPQGNAVYMSGQPSATDQKTRNLERAFANATAQDAYDATADHVAKWEVDQSAEQLLHFTDADPDRTPTFTVFPEPDFYLSSGTKDTCAHGTGSKDAATGCVFTNSHYAWNHGYYAPEVNNTWLGLVGPEVAHNAANNGLDGTDAGAGPNSDGTANNGTTTDTQIVNNGTWTDHTDTRPTIMAITGLKDDYVGDGRVLVQDLKFTPGQTSDSHFVPLAQCYKQLNSSVGQFGTDVIVSDTAAIHSGSPSRDGQYETYLAQLQQLGAQRDSLAATIKNDLWQAEFSTGTLPNAASEIASCQAILGAADNL